MIRLVQLLFKERWRKTQLQYGWVAHLSVGLTLLVTCWWLSAVAAHLTSKISTSQLCQGLDGLWIAWVFVGTLTGQDLFWRIRIERLILFPLCFGRLYAVSFALGFVSVPLLIGLGVFEVFSIAGKRNSGNWLMTLIAYVLLISTVRLSISLVRSMLYQSTAIRKPTGYAVWFLIPALMATLVAPGLLPGGSKYAPGHLFGFVLFGLNGWQPVLILAVLTLVLGGLDFAIQREVVYQGITGAQGRGGFRRAPGIFRLSGSSPEGTLRRIGLVGWLRHRTALIMFVFGFGYSFLFMYFNKGGDQTDYMMFCMMVLVFHGYMRGNLLGVDRQGAWLYFTLPVPAERAVRAKNASLTFLQLFMVVGVLLPAILQKAAWIRDPLKWLEVISFVASAILLGEILGSVFSVLHPEPIDRTSRYSGGMTVGALVVPTVQAVLFVLFFAYVALGPRFLSSGAMAIPLVGVPVLLWLVRLALFRTWVDQTMNRRRETILRKLSALSS